MNIAEYPIAKNWLDQFDIPDRYLASFMLSKLRYISFETLETWLQDELSNIIQILKNNGKKEAIAIFPVSKPFINEFNKDKEPKPPNDSSGRIAHSLKNMERNLPIYIELTPRINSMRERKVRHIIFVDDFIGTGDRFIKSWRESVSSSIKSWCSLGWCKVWILAYSAHEFGIKQIIRNVKPINRNNFFVYHTIKKSFIEKDIKLTELCSSYSKKFGDGCFGSGYGKLYSPIIFQHGCPNNVPSIFWKNGQRNRNRWNALFPNRSIPSEFYPIFNEDHSKESAAEELWIANYYKLALEFLDRPHDFNDEHQLLLILAYLNREKSINKIKSIMIMSDNEFDIVIKQLLKYGLINDEYQVTRFGKDILKRGEKFKHKNVKVEEDYINYYPNSFLGFQRDI